MQKDSLNITWERIYTSYDEVKNRKDLPLWFKESLKNIGKKYRIIANTGTLIGMSETNEDYYYVFKRDNGTRYFESCVGKITEI